MEGLHIYTAELQPATKYKMDFSPLRPLVVRCHGKAIRLTMCCKRPRWAGNLLIQVYYDGCYHFCREGTGCKLKKKKAKRKTSSGSSARSSKKRGSP